MKDIDININKARITSVALQFDNNGKIDLVASAALMCGIKKIASFDMRTDYGYGDNVKIPFPVDVAEPAASIVRTLEIILVRELNKHLKQLPETAVDAEVTE